MQAKANQPLRQRVERGIYKRKTCEGVIRCEVAYVDSDGKQRWRTEDNLRDARQARADLVSKVGRGERVAPVKITLAEFAEEWLGRQETRLRRRTRERYETYLRMHVKPRLGTRRLQSITVDDVADLMADMQKGGRYIDQDGRLTKTTGEPFSAWTIRSTVMVLGRVLGSAARSGKIATNPVRQLERGERPKVVRREFPPLDREAIGKLIAKTPEHYRTLVAVSVLTGIRQGEALGLRWQDVDVKAGVLRVRHQLDRHGELVEPKTEAAKRDVPIPASLAALLRRHREPAFEKGYAKPTDFVFASETGGPMHFRNIVRRGLEKATEAAGLPHLRWHDLRHLAASALIAESRGDDDHVSRVLGHANAPRSRGRSTRTSSRR
jgi:integrase